MSHICLILALSFLLFQCNIQHVTGKSATSPSGKPVTRPSGKPVAKPGIVKLCPGHPDVDVTLKTTYSFPTTHPTVQPLLRPFMPGGIVKTLTKTLIFSIDCLISDVCLLCRSSECRTFVTQ